MTKSTPRVGPPLVAGALENSAAQRATGNVIPIRAVRGVPSEMSDEAIILACAQGDTAALGALFDRFHRDVWRFLSRVLGAGCAEVEDLAQATFLEAWRSSPRFKGRSTVKSWIFGIANNLARHHMRKESRRRTALAAVAELVVAPRPPSERAHDRIMVARLMKVLETLTHDQRVAFVMCDVEQIRGVDAAKALGVRPGTLWRRLHYARRALRRALEEET